LAGRARGRIEVSGFVWGAADGSVVEGSGKDAADPVGGGVEVVDPVAPEDGQLGVRTYDAVEEGEHDEEEWEDIGDDGE